MSSGNSSLWLGFEALVLSWHATRAIDDCIDLVSYSTPEALCLSALGGFISNFETQDERKYIYGLFFAWQTVAEAYIHPLSIYHVLQTYPGKQTPCCPLPMLGPRQQNHWIPPWLACVGSSQFWATGLFPWPLSCPRKEDESDPATLSRREVPPKCLLHDG